MRKRVIVISISRPIGLALISGFGMVIPWP